MPLSLNATTIRAACRKIGGFRDEYIKDDDAKDALFEFAAMLGIVNRLQSATTGSAVVVEQGECRFARKPGARSKFNYVSVKPFDVYMGVEFIGKSGAKHAPDLVVAVTDPASVEPLPLLVVECKNYSNGAVPRHIANAFAGVLVDLNRPRVVNAEHLDVLQGCRFNDCVRHVTLANAAFIEAMPEAGWSILETTCTGVPEESVAIGKLFGFEIHIASSVDSLA